MHKKGIMIFIFLYVSLVCCFSFPRRHKDYYNKTEIIETENSYKIVIKSLKRKSNYELVEIQSKNLFFEKKLLIENDIILNNKDGMFFIEMDKKYFQSSNIYDSDFIFVLYNKKNGRMEYYYLNQ